MSAVSGKGVKMSRRYFLRSSLIFFWIVCTAFSCAKIPRLELTERDLELSIKHDGYARSFILHIPENLDEFDKVPLLFALHGGGGTAKGMIRLTERRFNELADRHGFLVVYPQGLEKSWNDERNDPISYAHEHNIDDLGFLKKVIAKMVAEYKADPERVFATGISNGGFMSIRISREMTEEVRAVAPVSASIPLVAKDAHLAAAPMNIMLINGTGDPLVPYEGGEVEVLGKKRGKIISTDEAIEVFVSRNGCSETPKEEEELKDRDPADGTRVIRYEYVNGETGNKVVLLKVRGGGHTWPGGWQYLREKHIGRTSRDINVCDEIWSFFNSL
jgi:polyhydroxybutyrate depolymerase